MDKPDTTQANMPCPAHPWVALTGVSVRDVAAVQTVLHLLGLSPLDTTRLGAISSKALKAVGKSWYNPPSWETGPDIEKVHPQLASFVPRAHDIFARAAIGARDSGPSGPGTLVFAHRVVASLLPLWQAAAGTPCACVLVVSDPLLATKDLAASDGLGGPYALACWERYQRSALNALRRLPVFVADPRAALVDPLGWVASLSDFLSRHGAVPATAPAIGPPPVATLRELLERPSDDHGDMDDHELVLASQLHLASLFGTLEGAHDRFDPPTPGQESPWVAAVAEGHQDIEQLWDGLDWAAEQLSRLDAQGPTKTCSQPDTVPYPPNASEDMAAYHRWLEARGEVTTLPLGGGLPTARSRVHLSSRPKFSVVVPVHRPPAWALDRCVASVLAQSYRGFQLVLADDASNDPELENQLRNFAHLDQRVEVIFRQHNGGISAATNSALDHARGEFVVFLDDDDELHPRALEKVAAAIAEDTQADIVYTDEDKISPSGVRYVPTLKPDWSPDLLLSCAYMCHLLAVRRSLVCELGGMRSDFDGSQDYDLMLRASERARSIVHVPEILYHWRVLGGSTSADPGAKPWAFQAEARALTEALARRKIDAIIEPHRLYAGHFHVRRAIADNPLVSLIVPFRDEPQMTAACYAAAVRSPGYENFEILLVDNSSELPETATLMEEMAKDPRVRIVSDPRAFDWVAINNAAVEQAKGDVLLFLNNDVVARSQGWLAAMVGHAVRDEVGAVGALLRYPDLTIQHAGIVLAMSWGAAHVQQGLPFGHPSYLLMADVTRNCTAVTGACLMTRRSCFEQIGGFDPALPVAFNDVDYCLRLRDKGLLVVYTPLAELVHHESKSRGHADDIVETPVFRARWRDKIERGDPYFNPNLTHFDPYCRLSTEEERDLWSIFRSMLEASSTN